MMPWEITGLQQQFFWRYHAGNSRW